MSIILKMAFTACGNGRHTDRSDHLRSRSLIHPEVVLSASHALPIFLRISVLLASISCIFFKKKKINKKQSA